ncbi:MAG: hypothetical protein FWC95_01440 [Defluviitaleaceae bacterium]|nr:hypothetical protein [Defluviitaleaceae bacterium]
MPAKFPDFVPFITILAFCALSFILFFLTWMDLPVGGGWWGQPVVYEPMSVYGFLSAFFGDLSGSQGVITFAMIMVVVLYFAVYLVPVLLGIAAIRLAISFQKPAEARKPAYAFAQMAGFVSTVIMFMSIRIINGMGANVRATVGWLLAFSIIIFVAAVTADYFVSRSVQGNGFLFGSGALYLVIGVTHLCLLIGSITLLGWFASQGTPIDMNFGMVFSWVLIVFYCIWYVCFGCLCLKSTKSGFEKPKKVIKLSIVTIAVSTICIILLSILASNAGMNDILTVDNVVLSIFAYTGLGALPMLGVVLSERARKAA